MTVSRRTFLAMSGTGAASVAARPLRHAIGRLGNLLASRGTDFEVLRASIKGSLILPSDAPYERARRVWSFNPTTDLRPAAIVRCAEANDVVKSVAFARAQSLEIAIRGGGHDILGALTCDGGLVIDLSAMKRVNVDPLRKTALVEPGVLSGELKAATVASRLAPVLGCNPSVGVAGLTLGGSIGWFAGTHGAACDNLVSATIATASGTVLRASADTNPDVRRTLGQSTISSARAGGIRAKPRRQCDGSMAPGPRYIGSAMPEPTSTISARARKRRSKRRTPSSTDVSRHGSGDTIRTTSSIATETFNRVVDAGLLFVPARAR